MANIFTIIYCSVVRACSLGRCLTTRRSINLQPRQCCSVTQAWRPYLRKDIDILEKVQRRTTKLITGLRDLSYDDRLKECGLTTLETRRLRGDQIEVFKILNGHENIDLIYFSKLRQVK